MLRDLLCKGALALVVALPLACTTSGGGQDGSTGSGLRQKDEFTLVPKESFLTSHPASNRDGTINVVIEIPAGTNAKWEVRSSDGALVREFTGQNPRVIQYLAYPGNYGMVPRTLLDERSGGDGGALDVMVLGPAIPRGSVVQAIPIGIIRLLDRAEQDDKILAVVPGTVFERSTDVVLLERHFPGVTDILRIWFDNYSGDAISYLGLGPRASAHKLIEETSAEFERRN
jgi:inorganic pyrophosphatase